MATKDYYLSSIFVETFSLQNFSFVIIIIISLSKFINISCLWNKFIFISKLKHVDVMKKWQMNEEKTKKNSGKDSQKKIHIANICVCVCLRIFFFPKYFSHSHHLFYFFFWLFHSDNNKVGRTWHRLCYAFMYWLQLCS